MNILFMCVGNSARSQIAEGLAKSMYRPESVIQSAGSEPARQVQPWAIKIMAEHKIDISRNVPKFYDQLSPSFLASIDFVITLCAEEVCPSVVSKGKRLHWPIPDPAGLPEEQKPDGFRSAYQKIEKHLEQFGRQHGLLR